MRSFFYYNSTASRSKQEQTETQEPFFQRGSETTFFHKNQPSGNTSNFFSTHPVQTKSTNGLTIGQPGDKYELEADAMADQVVQQINGSGSNNNGANGSMVQTKCEACEQQEQLQKKNQPLSDQITSIQRKPIFESEEDASTSEGQVQRKCAHCPPTETSVKAGEEKERVQKKDQEGEESTDIMKSPNGEAPSPSPGIASQLKNSKGGGAPLAAETKSSMEEAFGADFSRVKLHNDSQSAQMNKDLNAQAFTHGSDIYFNEGKYDESSSEGQHLLAHELTHVVQQRPSVKTPRIQRVCDNIPEVDNQFYGHGAFMGAAPQMMADSKWNRILEVLMPDVHSDATPIFNAGNKSDELILMFENNPVMGAYGTYQTHQMDVRNENGRSDRIEKMEAMEWDVFLPTQPVEDYNNTEDDDENEKLRLAGVIVNDMLIAHGNLGQTIRENASRGGSRQHDNVRKTRKSGQGGVRPGAWMDLFGRALTLASAESDESFEQILEEYRQEERVDSQEDQAAHLTFENQLGFEEVVDLYKRLFNKETFSVLLDVKSRDATPVILRALVEELNRRSIHVYGVGSFQHQELAGLSGMSQEINGEIFSGPKEVKFFHLAGDLQNACINNEVSEGDVVMFNAGSLLSHSSWEWSGSRMKASYRIKTEVVNQLRIYKEHYGFDLGVYVQENDIDDRAATMITELTNDNPDIFNLGFAWGGLSGQAASDIEPSATHATVGEGKGLSSQRWVGTDWNTDKPLPGAQALAPTRPGFSSTISIRHRFLESRRFTVSSGSVRVSCDADWDVTGCNPDTYYISLIREISAWPDSSEGQMGFPVGDSHSATWNGLEAGEYYLQIYFPTNTDPNCVLQGDIDVRT